MTSGTDYRLQLLDLLVDGPSSFAALYSAANRSLRSATSPHFTVDQTWEALASMAAIGWIRSRLMLPSGGWKDPDDADCERARREYRDLLSHTPYADTSVDNVGLWFELQPLGRAEWAKCSKAIDDSSRWRLEQDPQASTVTVRAASFEQAERVLLEWLGVHPEIELVEHTRVVRPCDGFLLRDGTFVERGISLDVTYREARQRGRSSY